MISELGLAATLVAALVSLPYLFSPIQVWVGGYSDRHPLLGYRRTPYIALGLLMCAGGAALAPSAAFMMASADGGRATLGVLLGALAFGAWGMGFNFATVSYLSLATDLAGEEHRARTVGVMWFMLIVSVLGAYAVWFILSFAVRLVHWDLPLALVLNAAVVALSWWIVQPLRHVRVPPVRARWYDLVVRALMIAVLVGTVVTLSFTIGAISTGNIAVFPIVLTSIALILHRRIGGPATAAILANAVIGLGGFGVAVATLYLTAERFGSPLALTVALAVSIGCNMMLYVMRKRAAAT